jgi:hypothetical protein
LREDGCSTPTTSLLKAATAGGTVLPRPMRTFVVPIKLAFLILLFVGCSSTGKRTDGGSGDSCGFDLPADMPGKADTSSTGGAPDTATSLGTGGTGGTGTALGTGGTADAGTVLGTGGTTTADAAKDIGTDVASDGGVDVGLFDSLATADAPDAPLPPLTMSPTVVDFGTVTVGVSTPTQTITFTAQAGVWINGVGGLEPAGVLIGPDTCYGARLRAGDSCTLEMTFTAESSGQISGEVCVGICTQISGQVCVGSTMYCMSFTAMAVSLDAGTTVDGLAAGDAQEALGADTIPDTIPDSCDLLKQDCPAKGMGCYRTGAAARCLVAGSVAFLGSCLTDNDCLPGLTCIALTDGSNIGTCLSLCDISNPTSICGVGSVCQALPGFPKTSNVGYCSLS